MKRALRTTRDDLDTEIKATFRAARVWLERQYGRTVNTTTTRKALWSTWPSGPIYLDYPPFIAVTHWKYYDTSNVLQTLATTNYFSLSSTDAKSLIEWSADAVLPDHYERPDAIQLTYTTGYASRDAIPEPCKQAIKVLASAWFLEDDPARIEKGRECAMSVMSAFDAAGYV